jgi:plastocyanin
MRPLSKSLQTSARLAVALSAVALLAAGCVSAPDQPSTTTGDGRATAADDGDDRDGGNGRDDGDGGDDGDGERAADGDRGENPADATSSGVRETDAPGDVEVDIQMFEFGDEVVEIAVGETVTWTNRDATRHTVTGGRDGEADGAFELTFEGRGDTASVTFDEPGEYHYFCAPHPFMTGTVVVGG